jgi:FlaA1/EpsC-like NDP-sugar epimerase
LSWRLRRVALAVFDVCCWGVALFIATVLRYELDLRQIEPAGVAMISGFGAAGVLAVSGPLQVYRVRHSIGTVGDAISVSTATGLVGFGLFVINVLHADPLVPRTVPLIATLIALVLAVGARLLVRLSRERATRHSK